MPPKILVAPRDLQTLEERYRPLLEAAGYVVKYPVPSVANQPTPSELDDALADVVAVIAGSETYSAELFDAFPQLRVVARVGVGYDAVDIPAATTRGVAVTITPGCNHESVAEHAFAMILGYTRQIANHTHEIRGGGWPRNRSVPIRGKTIGLAGLGRIGKAMVVRANAFRMSVFAYDPFPDRAFCEANNVTLLSFDELLSQSDFLSLHLPLTEPTRHLMNRETFAKMKPGAVLVNTSRGGLVCESDLVEAMQNKRIGAALLDVFEQEPPPQNHPLFAFDNVIFTPHAAGVDVQSLGDMACSAAESAIAILRGEWPAEKIVNPAARNHQP